MRPALHCRRRCTPIVTLVFMLLSQFDGWIAATGVGGLITLLGMSIGGFLGFLVFGAANSCEG